jgi:hypothetical protein
MSCVAGDVRNQFHERRYGQTIFWASLIMSICLVAAQLPIGFDDYFQPKTSPAIVSLADYESQGHARGVRAPASQNTTRNQFVIAKT